MSFKYFQRTTEFCPLRCFYHSIICILSTGRALISWGVDGILMTLHWLLVLYPMHPMLWSLCMWMHKQLFSKWGKDLDMECMLLIIPDGLYHLFCFLKGLSNLFVEFYLLFTPDLPDEMTFISHHKYLNSFSVYTKYWKCAIGNLLAYYRLSLVFLVIPNWKENCN